MSVMVGPAGVEPAVFLMSLIYSQLRSPLLVRTRIRGKTKVPVLSFPVLWNKDRKCLFYSLAFCFRAKNIARSFMQPDDSKTVFAQQKTSFRIARKHRNRNDICLWQRSSYPCRPFFKKIGSALKSDPTFVLVSSDVGQALPSSMCCILPPKFEL